MLRGAGGRGPGPGPFLGAPRPLAQPEGKAGLGHDPRLPAALPEREKSLRGRGEGCEGLLWVSANPQRRERSCPDPPRLRFAARGVFVLPAALQERSLPCLVPPDPAGPQHPQQPGPQMERR